MDDEAMRSDGVPPLTRGMPWPVWLLLAGAAVQLELSVWVFTTPNAAAALGMLAMIAGFGLGALAVHGGRAGGDPGA